MTGRTVLRGGSVVGTQAALGGRDASRGSVGEPDPGRDAETVFRADVAIEGGVIKAVGDIRAEPDDRVIDCSDRYVMPGFVDAHSHADGLLADDEVQLALLRQGVTTVVVGQDGLSYAPGDGSYATEYFAAINGAHPSYSGGGIAEYLNLADGSSRLNAAILVPAGTVRFEVCGRADSPADPGQLKAMVTLVEQGMREGAVGLSTGLDYVPGLFQSTEEIAALAAPVAGFGGVYVSHMRGGYEANAAAGIHEMTRIAQLVRARTGSALSVHVSHFHADADIVLGQLDALAAAGVDATFDAYPYIRGCSLLAMPLLPPDLSRQPVDAVVRVLRDPAERQRLRSEWFPRVATYPSLGAGWPSMITFAHIRAPEFAWAHGLTIDQASRQTGVDAIDLALDVLQASRLQVNVVMAVLGSRGLSELARIFAHSGHIGGSDAIFIGAHPHPRARGTFPRFLREYVREIAAWTWTDAARHLSRTAAVRFGLGRRGVIAPGAIADLIVVDPDAVTDTATYESPSTDAVGIDDVLVAGAPVLSGGRLSGGALHGALPGRGLRRNDKTSTDGRS
ncbi:amidohydrolase family protein [Planctomonas sp. JC2975]|uniref:N-acyl-D-amino-acid deacylase family protein n=1 Tax=Planctomonas sp. JC2975 TaxID=2729626 RepID=UPI001472A4F5|nr:amidohydrolase family protein [Planctomonas sp. JC2975]NNC11528.1 amidohydrolase family protein [Planctomonas sp. JC2975]